MDNRKIMLVALALATVPIGKVQAAIDDAGMKYVSASEGLSGSLRVRLLEHDSEQLNEGDRPHLTTFGGDSRLVYKGETQLGSGWAATYFLEIRPDTETLGSLNTEYLDVGLKGRLGHFRFGIVDSATDALIPPADRSNDAGLSGQQKLSSNYANGFRWISPDIGGFMLGISAETERRGRGQVEANNKESFDQYDMAFAYKLPFGVGLGVSYSVMLPSGINPEHKNKKGLRVGVDYSQSRWGIGYNFHSHKRDARIAQSVGFRETGGSIAIPVIAANFREGTVYKEHVFGANYIIGRFNLAANHSIAKMKSNALNINFEQDGNEDFDLTFSRSVIDVGYTLGSKAKLIAAYTINKTKNAQGYNLTGNAGAGGNNPETDEYYLLYRIDF